MSAHLCSTRREDDILGLAPDQPGQALSGLLYHGFRFDTCRQSMGILAWLCGTGLYFDLSFSYLLGRSCWGSPRPPGEPR